MPAHLRAVAGAVDVPVNADFEGGHAIEASAWAGGLRAAEESAATGPFGRFDGLPDVDALLAR
ncbi:hypothetical protein [Pseudactinotalea sp. HY158]|uniref:hypothetical protein n=1 Tax=Pseudactinotalea sp. HY158 TaxID=2654547 RepID=UPI00129C9EAD|nr:hypothetical protein [Pseudactinotalea sp. HY158]QGH68878.1 hypothetical protein GCE65_04715 [Pseudactinotalea sp. HY158]